MNKIKEYINKIKRYIRYLRICNALKVWLIPWQRDFVLNNEPFPPYVNEGRGNGKTITVLIKLMLDTDCRTTKPDVVKILFEDKDFVVTNKMKTKCYQDMYNEMREKCLKKGIKVSKIDFMNLSDTRYW